MTATPLTREQLAAARMDDDVNGNVRLDPDAVDALLDERDVLLAAEGRDAARLWTCPDCAFAFDAMHTDANGSHSCPACAEQALRDTIDAMTKAMVEQRAIDEQTLRVAGEQVEAMHRERDEARAALAEATAQRNDAERSCDAHVEARAAADHDLRELRADLTLCRAHLADALQSRAAGRCPRCHNSTPPDTGCATCAPEVLGERLRVALADLALTRAQLADAQETASRAAGDAVALRDALGAAFEDTRAPHAQLTPTRRQTLDEQDETHRLLSIARHKMLVAFNTCHPAPAPTVAPAAPVTLTSPPMTYADVRRVVRNAVAPAACAGCDFPNGAHRFSCMVGGVRAGQVVLPATVSRDGAVTVAAPTLVPAAGEAKRCETCGGTGTVQPPSLGMVGLQMGIDYTPTPCPSCAPEKGGAR